MELESLAILSAAASIIAAPLFLASCTAGCRHRWARRRWCGASASSGCGRRRRGIHGRRGRAAAQALIAALAAAGLVRIGRI